jgi:hypothetical protein
MPFRLTPPTQITLLVSVVLAVILRLTHAEIPILGAHTFAALAIAYLVLLAGNVIEGI